MMSCDDFEVQIEMKLHGALSDEAALDSHLTSCASCRAFEAIARRTEQTMTATVRMETPHVDWQNVRNAISRRLVGDGRRQLATLLVLFFAQSLAMLAFNPEQSWAMIVPRVGLAAAIAASIVVWSTHLRRRRMREYETSREDLFFFHRAYLESRLWSTSVGGVSVVPLGAAYLGARIIRNTHVSLVEWLAAAMMSFLLLGLSAWLLIVQRRRLMRELAAFKKP
jgi:hypothetical protein